MEQYDQATAKKDKEDLNMGNTCNQTQVRWKKPSVGVVKLNWDAAVDERTGNVGLGVIARDYEGRVLAMHGSFCKHIYNPTTAETLAAWKAVDLGVHLGVIFLEMEGDAKEVVQGINCASQCLGCDGPVLNDIKSLLQSFNTWKVTHVNRGANGAAHSLARLALSGEMECIWFENFPPFVLEIVSVEQT
jgi:ribonuclease HI